MNKKKMKIQNLVAKMRKVANSLSEDARAQWDEMVAAVEELDGDEDEHTITELNDRIAEIEGKYAQQEEVTNRIQAVRDELAGMVQGSKNVKDKFTPEVRRAIANAIMNSHGVRNTLENIEAACKQNGIEVRTKKNSISGLTFAEVIDYALQLKQEIK